MGVILELARTKQKVKQLEAELVEAKANIADLAEQLELGIDKPSPADIVPRVGILADDYAKKFIIDMHQVNIPFTKPPRLLPIMDIPNSKSMDGLFDYGNNNLYIKPVDEANHKIMVDWIAQTWLLSSGKQTVDAVYRIMVNDLDDPNDFTKPHLWYAIHRLVDIGYDTEGRFFWFAGINNLARDNYPARDKNIIWLNIGTIF